MNDLNASLMLDIVRYGWTRGHTINRRRRRLTCLLVNARRGLAVLLLLAGVSLIVVAVIDCEEDHSHFADSAADIKPPQGGKAHASGKIGDVVHGLNIGCPATHSKTMKCTAFQGAA